MESNHPEIRFQVLHSDGSIPNNPFGYYWRLEIGPGHFGDTHGPFSTDEEAASDARAYISLAFMYGETPMPAPKL